jgi:hypothetical protein
MKPLVRQLSSLRILNARLSNGPKDTFPDINVFRFPGIPASF